MNRSISLVGQNSNDIYTLHYPESILRFCQYDFSNFIVRCTELCKKSMQSGSVNQDDLIVLRNSISACHRYYEMNTRSAFEKIVVDLWIEYLCREKNTGIVSLWNSFLSCSNKFEKIIFTRLTEYRHNKAINQWVNLLKIQEYAQKKIDFIFGEKVADTAEARAKRDYFDLMMNVTANELGYPVEQFASAKVYSVGRLPNSPFILGGVAKEIAKTVLGDLEYSENATPVNFHAKLSDQTAMDAFSAMKAFIPQKMDNVIGTIIKTMKSMPSKVYIPEGFKSVIDLEIDLILESNAVLQKCGRCLEYYLKDDDYNENYCNHKNEDGQTCLEIMHQVPAISFEEMEKLESMSSEVYLYMSNRINVDMTQRDFGQWYQYFMTMRENIAHHNVSVNEMSDFVSYSKTLQFHQHPLVRKELEEESQPVVTESTPVETTEEKEVKPFVFKRIDRSELYKQQKKQREREERERDDLGDLFSFDEIHVEQPTTEIPPAPHIIKAEDTEETEFSVFENPFDGVFDDKINDIESNYKDLSFKRENSKSEPQIELPIKPEKEKSSEPPKMDFRELLNSAHKRQKETPYSESNKAVNAYKTVAEDAKADDFDNIFMETDFDILPKKSNDNATHIHEQKQTDTENNDGFSQHLRGINRTDGFEKTELPKDKPKQAPKKTFSERESIEELTSNIRARSKSGDEQVSHKTKRVMDAILNPAKTTSNFVKNADNSHDEN